MLREKLLLLLFVLLHITCLVQHKVCIDRKSALDWAIFVYLILNLLHRRLYAVGRFTCNRQLVRILSDTWTRTA